MTKIEDQARAKINYVLEIGTSREYINTMWELLEMIGMIAPSYESSLPTQRDEVVVKQYIADWYEENKGDLTQGMFNLTRRTLEAESRNKRTEMQNLLYDGDVDLIELFYHMKDGYAVEKEPLYYVILAEKKDGWKYTYWDSEGSVDFTNKKENIQTFTENEIKVIDERYWAFAVPVKEDE